VVNHVGRFPDNVQALAVLRRHDEFGAFFADFFQDRIRAVSKQLGRVRTFRIGVATRSQRLGKSVQNVVRAHS
jgi:hypothetical protein